MPEDIKKGFIQDTAKSLGLVEESDIIELSKEFEIKLRDLGINDEDLQILKDNEDNLTAPQKRKKNRFDRLLKALKAGETIDPVYYPRDKSGKFTGRHAHTWKKGMKSPNPLGRTRPKVHLYARFCQIMEMTEDEKEVLSDSPKLTLADKAAIELANKVKEGMWSQQLEIINREEGKVQENIQIEVPPQPIRFMEAPDRIQPDLLDEELPDVKEPVKTDDKVIEESETKAEVKVQKQEEKVDNGKPEMTDKEALEDESLWGR